jgi:hypothetical protein
MISGAVVRDAEGTTGRVMAWNLPEIKIGWEDKGQLLAREESLTTKDARLKSQIEVLTFDAGWVPLARFAEGVAVPSSAYQTLAQMRKLIGEADELLEKGKQHWPYKSKSKLGPGPRGGTNAQTDDWNCSCSNYSCNCKGPDGRKKRVVIDKGYKSAYNREYKSWIKGKK